MDSQLFVDIATCEECDEDDVNCVKLADADICKKCLVKGVKAIEDEDAKENDEDEDSEEDDSDDDEDEESETE